MEIFKMDSSRRNIIFGGLIFSIASFFKSYFGGPAHKTKNIVNQHGTASLSFLKTSGDAKNYVNQIDVMRKELISNLKKSRPDKSEQIEHLLADEFWTPHFDQICNGFHIDIQENLTAQDIQAALTFFNTPEGQNYLKWKDLVQSRKSNNYRAIEKMHYEVGQINRKILDKEADYKWKLS